MHMKAIAYHITAHEKECLVIANHKKHDLTFIANKLTMETLNFALGKKVIILFNHDRVNAAIIEGLSRFGIRYIITSAPYIQHIDLEAVKKASIYVISIPFTKGRIFENMQLAIDKLDSWSISSGH